MGAENRELRMLLETGGSVVKSETDFDDSGSSQKRALQPERPRDAAAVFSAPAQISQSSLPSRAPPQPSPQANEEVKNVKEESTTSGRRARVVIEEENEGEDDDQSRPPPPAKREPLQLKAAPPAARIVMEDDSNGDMDDLRTTTAVPAPINLTAPAPASRLAAKSLVDDGDELLDQSKAVSAANQREPAPVARVRMAPPSLDNESDAPQRKFNPSASSSQKGSEKPDPVDADDGSQQVSFSPLSKRRNFREKTVWKGSACKVSRKDRLNFLSKVELFSNLDQTVLSLICAVCEDAHFTKDEVLFSQGDNGSDFFVVVGGSVSVVKDGHKVNTLGPGTYFGELALLHDQPRNATILADEDVHAMKIERANFEKYGLAEKIQFPGKKQSHQMFKIEIKH